MSSEPPRKGNRWDSDRGVHNWKAVARRLSKNPEEWVRAARDVTTGTVQNVRRGKIIPIRDLGGTLNIATRNNSTVGGTRYCDLYLRWSPTTEENESDVPDTAEG